MQKLTYPALFVVGTLAVVWALLLDHQATLPEPKTDAENPWTDLDTLDALMNIGNNQIDSDPESADILTPEPDDLYCGERCLDGIEILRFPSGLTDHEYENLLGRIAELATFLRNNPAARAEFIELADTGDADKRSVIMDVFNQLDVNARRSLGEALIEASDWHSRFDGVRFLAQPDIMDNQFAQRFSDMLILESNHYVRTSLVKALNQPDKFYGDEEILYVLEQVGYGDRDNIVRGESLLARVQLEQEPEAVFYDVMSAIRSKESDYQGYGLRALEQIITRKSQSLQELSLVNQDEAKNLFLELMNPEYDDMPANLRKMADDLYERYF